MACLKTGVDEILKAKNGDSDMLDLIVKRNMGLVWSIVKRFKGRGYEMEDLYQIGCLGLVKSIQRFDENFNVKLSTFAVPYILGEIKRFLRDDGAVKVSRSIKEIASKINVIRADFEKKGKKLELSYLIKELKVSKEDIMLALGSTKQPESIQEKVFDDNGVEKGDLLLVQKSDEEETLNKIIIKEQLDRLDRRDREIIVMRYFKEKTQMEVAKSFGISQVQVSRIEKKVLYQMRERIGGIS